MINQSQHYQLSLINKNHNIKVDEDSNNPYKKEKKIQHFINYKKRVIERIALPMKTTIIRKQIRKYERKELSWVSKSHNINNPKHMLS